MALTLNVYDSDDESVEVKPRRRTPSARSATSHTSSIPPPLPTSAPPTKPPGGAPDAQNSADEISDIEEDVSSLPPLPKSRSEHRAKSAERDSDFSEGTWTLSGRGGHHGGHHMRSATSLDSITDSGTCQEEDVKILKERIQYLETLCQVRELRMQHSVEKMVQKSSSDLSFY